MSEYGTASAPPYTLNGPPYPSEPPPKYEYDPGHPPPPPPPLGPTAHIHQHQPGSAGYQQHSTVIVQEVLVGPHPHALTCPYCQAFVSTSVEYTPGLLAWLAAAGLCLIGCWPCACLPCCINDCQDATHYCPYCRTYIGTYARL